MHEVNLGIIHLRIGGIKGKRVARSIQILLRSDTCLEYPDANVRVMVLVRYWKYKTGSRIGQLRMFEFDRYTDRFLYNGAIAKFANEKHMVDVMKRHVAEFFADR